MNRTLDGKTIAGLLTALFLAIAGLLGALTGFDFTIEGVQVDETGAQATLVPSVAPTSEYEPTQDQALPSATVVAHTPVPKCFGIVGWATEATGDSILAYQDHSLDSAAMEWIEGATLYPLEFVWDEGLVWARVAYNGQDLWVYDQENFPICDSPGCECPVEIEATATPWPTTEPVTTCMVGNVGEYNVNLRSGPGSWYSVVGQFKPQEYATVVAGNNKTWLKIKLANGSEAHLAGWLQVLQFSEGCDE